MDILDELLILSDDSILFSLFFLGLAAGIKEKWCKYQ